MRRAGHPVRYGRGSCAPARAHLAFAGDMRTVALFGGSFNPPHVGHVQVVAWLLSTRRADEVWLLPTAHHPFGKELAPFADRVAMARAALSVFAGTDRIVRVEEIEAELPAPSYTIHTVEALQARHAGVRFALVVGTDVLRDGPKWKDFDRLRTLVELLVVRRAGVVGSEPDPDPEHPTPLFPEVSSTGIRARISRGEDVAALVPAAVLDHLRSAALYR